MVTPPWGSSPPTQGEYPPPWNPVRGFPPKDRVGGPAYHIGVAKEGGLHKKHKHNLDKQQTYTPIHPHTPPYTPIHPHTTQPLGRK